MRTWGVIGKRKRCPLFSALSFGCAVLVASPSWAAVVEPGYGDLTINQGQGFKPVTSRVSANVGDSVMVGPGGAATVVYEDGCKVDVRPGAVMTIAPTVLRTLTANPIADRTGWERLLEPCLLAPASAPPPTKPARVTVTPRQLVRSEFA
jgi:hypothetical protein